MKYIIEQFNKASAGAILTCLIIMFITAAGCSQATKSTFEPQKESTTSAYIERYRIYRIERGKQLVNLGGCDKCHTPKVKTILGLESDPERFLSGYPEQEPVPEVPVTESGRGDWENVFYTTDGTVWVGRWGVSFAANITPDPETGIGGWTEERFIDAFRDGMHTSDENAVTPPMPMDAYSQLSDEELRSIFLYLQTVRPIKNKVPASIRPDDSNVQAQ